jgi:hypothetical protein
MAILWRPSLRETKRFSVTELTFTLAARACAENVRRNLGARKSGRAPLSRRIGAAHPPPSKGTLGSASGNCRGNFFAKSCGIYVGQPFRPLITPGVKRIDPVTELRSNQEPHRVPPSPSPIEALEPTPCTQSSIHRRTDNRIDSMVHFTSIWACPSRYNIDEIRYYTGSHKSLTRRAHAAGLGVEE